MNKANKIFETVFLWLTIGFLITFVGGSILLIGNLVVNPVIILFAQVVAVIIGIVEFYIRYTYYNYMYSASELLKSRIIDSSPSTIKVIFVLYAILEAFKFAAILNFFHIESVILAFGITAILFIIIALLGFSVDKKSNGIIIFIVFALLIFTGFILVSMAENSELLEIIISLIIIAISMAFAALEIQILRKEENYFYEEENLTLVYSLFMFFNLVSIYFKVVELIDKLRNKVEE